MPEPRREDLLRSLDHQRRVLAESIVLTPVDSLPFALVDRAHTAFLHGLYLTDKVRDREQQRDTVIQFAGRSDAADDLAAIHRLVARRFGGAAGSLRLLSGLHAHASTFMSVADIGQTVLLLPEEGGGHFNTHAILRRLGLKTLDLPLDHARLCVDRVATVGLIERVQPDFIFIDRSEGLRYEDFSFIGELDGPTKVFDASQYVAPILTGRYDNPLSWGFDLLLFSLHKNFPGPQKAGVVGRESGELWGRLMTGLSTLVSSSHAENTYLTGLALLREDWIEQYTQQMLATAVNLEAELGRRGLPVVARSEQGDPDWPPTHHIWIRCGTRDGAFETYERLAQTRVHTNYRKLPYGLGYGLRLGTTFAAVAGIDQNHVAELADIVATAVRGGSTPLLRRRVADLASAARERAIVPPEYWT